MVKQLVLSVSQLKFLSFLNVLFLSLLKFYTGVLSPQVLYQTILRL